MLTCIHQSKVFVKFRSGTTYSEGRTCDCVTHRYHKTEKAQGNQNNIFITVLLQCWKAGYNCIITASVRHSVWSVSSEDFYCECNSCNFILLILKSVLMEISITTPSLDFSVRGTILKCVFVVITQTPCVSLGIVKVTLSDRHDSRIK